MSLIQILDCMFGYEGSAENVFDNLSLSLDTSWKLGLVGRNGKGKTTLLRLLAGHFAYQGKILSDRKLEYSPCFTSGSGRMGDTARTFYDWAFRECSRMYIFGSFSGGADQSIAYRAVFKRQFLSFD